MRKLLYVFLVLLTVTPAYAQETERSVEALKILVQRSRESTAKCETDLADIWSQANELNKAYQKVLQELTDLKKETEKK